MALGQQGCRSIPVNTGVGDRDAVGHLTLGLFAGLTASADIGLQHDAEDGTVPVLDLMDDVACYQRLQLMILAGVTVTAVHD